VLSSAIAAFFYVRVIVLMFFNDPAADGPAVVVSPTSAAAVAVGALATVVLGVVPGPALHLAQSAASQLFVR
jgi:NADH-quinone oxidoreductase subunit N